VAVLLSAYAHKSIEDTLQDLQMTKLNSITDS